jgi:hypothetical protein
MEPLDFARDLPERNHRAVAALDCFDGTLDRGLRS